MGIIVAKFKKKNNTLEILESLEKNIKSIEEFGKNTEITQRKIVVNLLLFSIFLYLVAAFIYYLYFITATFHYQILYILPLSILPFILFFIKNILTWYYGRKLRLNEKKLIELKEEKKKILDEVMDKETYKVAKTILDKFAPEQIRRSIVHLDNTPNKSASFTYNGRPELRQRLSSEQFHISQMPRVRAMVSSTPQRSSIPRVSPPSPYPVNAPLPLPRSILPRERTVLDKMVDYLVGDGPSNRYALVCKQCCSHNGMALKEEFEYLSFRCCYCLTFNPARKRRPSAPQLQIENNTSNHNHIDHENDLKMEYDDDGPIITEVRGESYDDIIIKDNSQSLSEKESHQNKDEKDFDEDTKTESKKNIELQD